MYPLAINNLLIGNKGGRYRPILGGILHHVRIEIPHRILKLVTFYLVTGEDKAFPICVRDVLGRAVGIEPVGILILSYVGNYLLRILDTPGVNVSSLEVPSLYIVEVLMGLISLGRDEVIVGALNQLGAYLNPFLIVVSDMALAKAEDINLTLKSLCL